MQKHIECPWSLPAHEILASLETTEAGLTEKESLRRRAIYGKNIFHKHEKKSPFTIFIKQLGSPLIFILIGAGLVTAALQEWAEVVVISLAVLVNAGLGFYREYHAENTLEKLSSFIKDRSRVIRAGREEEVDSEILVPGDVIKLSYGNRVAADARILSENNLSIDEAILTGESAPIRKSAEVKVSPTIVAERSNMVHAGTLVVEGFVAAVVVATGDKTEIGKIAGLVSGTPRGKTPLQKGLARLAWIIFGIVICIVIGIFILGISRGESVLEMLVLSVAVSVGAVPEALPIALTVILAIGAERVAKRKGIVRTLIAAETLGSTSLIMTDKTGTLTEANMRLVGIHTKEELAQGGASMRISDTERYAMLRLSLQNVHILVENPDQDISAWTFKGKPFEVNIVKTAREKGIDISGLRADRTSSIVIPFNSTHKFSVSVSGSEYIVMGAPDILLARSEMDSKERGRIQSWITSASREGRRLIALGKTHAPVHTVSDVKRIEFVGILAFYDPIRKEVPGAVRKIESLGVRLVIVTGDLKGTAVSVAEELGWTIANSEILTGEEIAAMPDDALRSLLPSIKIFARVTPEDKMRIGLLYKSMGEVVAMTGDGVNDAPSLKAMDIGVALGSGSDVAKDVADIVLLDDNFEIISMSIEEGRRILVNIRKTFVYLMSNSLDEVFVIGGSLLTGIALPLSALQIIWVNLFTGSLPAIAFAYDEDFDHEKSKPHTLKTIFTREVNILTFGIGILSSLLLFIMYYLLVSFGVPIALARSVFFACFASYILVIAFSFRSLRKPLFSYPVFSNGKLNKGVIVAVLILIATMTVPGLRNLFGLAALPAIWIWFIAGWLVLNIFLVETAKYIFRLREGAPRNNMLK